MSIKFKINVKGLLASVTPAAIVATTGALKDFASTEHLSLEATTDCLFVTANGGRLSSRIPVHYESNGIVTDYAFQESGSVTVKAKDLIDVLESFHATEILTIETCSGEKPELSNDASEEERASLERFTGIELKLSPASDPEQMQTLPILSVPVQIQEVKGAVQKSVVMSRAAFCRGASRILFARGFEEKRDKFQYWKLLTINNITHFVASSGPRLAEAMLRGQGVADAADIDEILIPADQTVTMLKVLGETNYPTVTIKKMEGKLVFEAESLKIVCVGLNPDVQWPNEQKFLNRTNLYRFTVPIDELGLAIKGMVATNSDEIKKYDPVHTVTLKFDTEKKIVSFFSDRSTKKALRKVKLADVWTSGDQDNEASIKVVVNYLDEVVKHSEKSKYVQFEMIGYKMPLLVRYTNDEHVVQDPVYSPNPNYSGEETFTMMISNLA